MPHSTRSLRQLLDMEPPVREHIVAVRHLDFLRTGDVDRCREPVRSAMK